MASISSVATSIRPLARFFVEFVRAASRIETDAYAKTSGLACINLLCLTCRTLISGANMAYAQTDSAGLGPIRENSGTGVRSHRKSIRSPEKSFPSRFNARNLGFPASECLV